MELELISLIFSSWSRRSFPSGLDSGVWMSQSECSAKHVSIKCVHCVVAYTCTFRSLNEIIPRQDNTFGMQYYITHNNLTIYSNSHMRVQSSVTPQPPSKISICMCVGCISVLVCEHVVILLWGCSLMVFRWHLGLWLSFSFRRMEERIALRVGYMCACVHMCVCVHAYESM